MVTKREFRFVLRMLKLRIWHETNFMRVPWVMPRRGTTWLHEWMLNRQIVDDYHHAPCCPANHYCKRRLVFSGCTCGATKHEYR